jgi:TonB-linked SusC/RagA family outer membrane protein
MKHYYNIKNNLLICLAWVFVFILAGQTEIRAQETEVITVQGVVQDETGQPLTGAAVAIEGTTTGTITDIDGIFTLPCPKGSTLTITLVGYKSRQVTIVSAEKPNIILEEDLVALEEAVVVAIGYGTMRKSDLTGAIASVSADDFKKGVVSSSEQLLQGKIAGLTVIQGSGDLKDASAAAIYGSRGANGVIIVTTNRSGKGKSAEYSAYVAIGTVANHLDLLSANQWRQYVRENEVVAAVDYGADTDWQKEIEQTSISHSHTLSFSNGDENGGFRISLNYLNNEGVIRNSHLDRLGGSITANQYVLNNRLKIEGGIHSNFDKWSPIDTRIFERTYNVSPVIPVRDENGEFTAIAGTRYENPVEINTNRYADNSRHRFLGYGKAELDIFKGLKGVANVSYEYNSAQSQLYKPTYAVMEGQADKGYGQKTLGDYTTMQLETYLTYSLNFMTDHKFSLMGGYSYLDNTYNGFGAERRGFDTDLFLYNNLASGQDYRTGDVYSYKGNAKLISFFARANYNFKGRYMLTATIRRDGSSRFGANNKWGMFPSASAAWRISNESFMEALTPWLNNLKLRVGYGVTGNQDGIGEYKSLSILGAGGASYYDAVSGTWKQSYGPTQNPNPDLKWESTSQVNIGLDFSVFSRINGTLELYQKETSDLLYTYAVPQPPYLVGTILANVGDLSNKGVELTLNANLLKTKDFTWDMNLALSHNKQKIEKLSNQVYDADTIRSGSLHGLRGMSDQYALLIIEGYPVGAFFGPVCEEIDTLGEYVLEDGGKVQYLGTVQPKLSFGFSTRLTYRQFDLDIATYGMVGQKVLNATAMSLSDPTRLPAQNVTDEFLESGITAKPTYSSYWIEDASFLRLQSLTLGYNFTAKKIGFEQLRLYVTGENLFVITGYSGVDPEVSIDGLASPGMDMFNYFPKARTVLIGINVSL